jgi:hypothetical protein
MLQKPSLGRSVLGMAGGGAATELTNDISNNKQFNPGDMAKNVAANALIGAATHGAVKLGGKLGEIKNIGSDPIWGELQGAVKAPSLANIQLPTAKPLNLNVPKLASTTEAAWNKGVHYVQNAIGHNDILAAYLPGTSIEIALVDIKAKTGIDLPKLAANYQAAQGQKPLAELLPANPLKSQLAKASGAYNNIKLKPPILQEGKLFSPKEIGKPLQPLPLTPQNVSSAALVEPVTTLAAKGRSLRLMPNRITGL